MTATALRHKVVSRDQWPKARLAHLEAEKELTRRRDELSRLRRNCPGREWRRTTPSKAHSAPRHSPTSSLIVVSS